MSVVTNVILSFSIMEDEWEGEDGHANYYILDKINEWLDKYNHSTFGPDIGYTEVAGGNKHLETPLFIAAFNYFDYEGFIEFLKSLPWKEPDCVQLFLQTQHEDRFTLYELEGQSSPQDAEGV